jgi:hypothetical protein
VLRRPEMSEGERPVTVPDSTEEFVDACAEEWYLEEFLELEPEEDQATYEYDVMGTMNVQDWRDALLDAFKAGFRKAEETLDRRKNK